MKLALQIIQNNEKILAGRGLTRLENETWVVVKLVRDNRKRGCVWEGREDGELEGMCRIAVEILKMLDAGFAKGRVESSVIAKLMKEAAARRGLGMEVGVRDEDVRGTVKKTQRSRRSSLWGEEDVSGVTEDSGEDDYERASSGLAEDAEHYDEYTTEDGANLFILGLIIGLVFLVLVLLYRGGGRRECIIEKTQWAVKH